MKRLFDQWEKLRRRHFLQVWALLYANRDKEEGDNWNYEVLNDKIKKIQQRWIENDYLAP